MPDVGCGWRCSYCFGLQRFPLFIFKLPCEEVRSLVIGSFIGMTYSRPFFKLILELSDSTTWRLTDASHTHVHRGKQLAPQRICIILQHFFSLVTRLLFQVFSVAMALSWCNVSDDTEAGHLVVCVTELGNLMFAAPPLVIFVRSRPPLGLGDKNGFGRRVADVLNRQHWIGLSPVSRHIFVCASLFLGFVT